MSTGSGPGNIFSSVKDFLLFNSQAATIPNIKQSYFLFHTSIGTIHVSAILTSWQSSPHRDCISMVLCDAASLQRLYYRNLKDALLCPWKLINCGEINAAQIPCQPQLQSLQPSGASIRIIIKKIHNCCWNSKFIILFAHKHRTHKSSRLLQTIFIHNILLCHLRWTLSPSKPVRLDNNWDRNTQPRPSTPIPRRSSSVSASKLNLGMQTKYPIAKSWSRVYAHIQGKIQIQGTCCCCPGFSRTRPSQVQ